MNGFSSSVPDTEAVLRAALAASWRRDKRVARRRIAWRWTLWYLQRYSPHVLALAVLVLVVGYLAGVRLPANMLGRASVPTGAQHLPVPTTVPATLAHSSRSPLPTGGVGDGLSLQHSWQLAVRASASISTPTDTGPTDTLSLKPETWLHSKEP